MADIGDIYAGGIDLHQSVVVHQGASGSKPYRRFGVRVLFWRAIDHCFLVHIRESRSPAKVAQRKFSDVFFIFAYYEAGYFDWSQAVGAGGEGHFEVPLLFAAEIIALLIALTPFRKP